MAVKQKKEKPTPARCVCGAEAAVVRFKGKKAVSCPNPEKCEGNLMTQWFSGENEAIVAWNSMVNSFKYSRR